MIQSLTPIKISIQGSIEEILKTGLKKVVEISTTDRVTNIFFQIVPVEIIESKSIDGRIKIESNNALGIFQYDLKINSENFNLHKSIERIVEFLKTKINPFEKVFLEPKDSFERARIVTFNCRVISFENKKVIGSSTSNCYKAVWIDPDESKAVEAVTLEKGIEFRELIKSLSNFE